MQNESVLDPSHRTLYTEILQPPVGFEFSKGLATTYSLDLETAISIPAIITLGSSSRRDDLLTNHLDLLKGIYSVSKNIMIFCEAGRIASHSKKQTRITALLEDMVTEVVAPRGGAFHPKLWVLRFKKMNSRNVFALRLIILSRNLTKSRCWDISLYLDGCIGNRNRPANAPLAELLLELPQMSRCSETPTKAQEIAVDLAKDLMHTKWELPPNFTSIQFAVNGLKSSSRNSYAPRAGKKLAIVSPFLSLDAIRTITRNVDRKLCWLVSRKEELENFPDDIRKYCENVKVMGDYIEDINDIDSLPFEQDQWSLSNLHAKIFVTEQIENSSNTTSLTIGSGNATNPALISKRNVEVFATLTGLSSKVGSVQDHMENSKFAELLYPWVSTDTKSSESDEEKCMKMKLENFRKVIVKSEMTLECTTASDNLIGLTLCAKKLITICPNIKMEVWPLSKEKCTITPVNSYIDHRGVKLGMHSLADVTGWIYIRLSVKLTSSDTKLLTISFARGVDLVGFPADRLSTILRPLFHTRQELLKYIYHLMDSVHGSTSLTSQRGVINANSPSTQAPSDDTLLEDMIHSLLQDGKELQYIDRSIKHLDSTNHSKVDDLDSFIDLWKVFRKAMPRGKRGE